MMINSLALFAGLVSLSSAAAETLYVNVSNSQGALTYQPQYLNATSNDTVIFTFQKGNHTLTQSKSVDDPCSRRSGGIDSGFEFVNASGTNSTLPTFSITVNNSEPAFFYCKQGANTSSTHCGRGMVFALNPGANGSNTSFAEFEKNALAVGAALNATNGTNTNATGTSSAPATTGTTSHSGATSFNVGVIMLMAAVGASFGLLA